MHESAINNDSRECLEKKSGYEIKSHVKFQYFSGSQHKMSKEDMATVSASAERYIGTQGGGMDQAIAFLGKAGKSRKLTVFLSIDLLLFHSICI